MGYYDVRLWVTDGSSMGHHVIFGLKVTRGGEAPETGSTAAVVAMTLSATDMTVPFSAFTAEVTRSYNSQDTYEPGPLGYGWRLGGLRLGIDAINQGSGEYDEAQIELPDGRSFFFANSPPEDHPELSAWATRSEYIARPYGMQLYRPGGSRQTLLHP